MVTATNRDLAREVPEGRFRQDLYDRISVIPIRLPPLRERPEDIEPLARCFLDEFNRHMNRKLDISAEGLEWLRQHTWPDNVRGLRNYIERTVALADLRLRVLGPDHLPPLDGARLDRASDVPTDVLARALAELTRELTGRGRHNQARILGKLRDLPQRQTKGELAIRVGVCRPVLRRELQELIAFALKREIPMEFFESRLALRDEDLERIERLRI